MSRALRALAFAALPILASAQAPGKKPTVAFFYGKPIPVAELGHFDWVVVEPGNVEAGELAALKRAGAQAFAYLSLGEAREDAVAPGWVIGRNAGWGSVIMNPAAPGWRDRVLQRAHALWELGYRGLFLDTLDSYMAALKDPGEQRAAGAALASLIRALHAAHPGFHLFFNRGFELLADVGPLASGLAAESLFFGWDAGAKRYVEVPAPDRKWLSGKLQEVKERLGIPVVAVDYLPPARRELARDAARSIESLGFVPWIATPALDVLGVGSIEVVPRRVLFLRDGAENQSLAQSPLHRLAALPAEHLGFVPEYVDVRKGLPAGVLAGRYAGIVTWFLNDDLPGEIGYPEWLLRQIDAGLRVAVFGRLGFAPSAGVLSRLGLAAVAGEARPTARITRRDSMVGLEAEPALRSRGLSRLRAASPAATVHLGLEDSAGRTIHAVVTTPWGGFALDPYLLEVGYEGRVRWIVDPFAFLQRALNSDPGPVLDLTTENGARLLVVTADGAGSSRKVAGARTAAEVISREVLEPLPLATTVVLPATEPGTSGSSGSAGKSVLALPSVELASHAYLAGGSGQGGVPTLAALAPTGRPDGDRFQAYLPGLTETTAAELLSDRILDRAHVAALADLAESPRRLKPIGIHYSFQVAEAPGAVRSLTEALRWALGQRTLPVWESEYARRVEEFRAASLVRRLDGTWTFSGLRALRTVRIPRALGWPDLARSHGVASITERGDALYISFSPVDEPSLMLAPSRPQGPYIAWSNATLLAWETKGRVTSLRLRGQGPVRLEVGGVDGACTLTVRGRRLLPAAAGGRNVFSVADSDTGEATLECRDG